GGYDSSAITALLQKNRGEKIKTFSIGYKEAEYNEAQYAKQVAQHLGTEHHEYYCTSEDAARLIPEIPYYFDEPFADSSAIPTMMVSAFARKHVTVSLSADAGDEIFAGYGKYQTFINYYKRFQAIPAMGKKLLHAGLTLYPQNSGLDRWIYNDMTRVSKVGDLLMQKNSIEDYLKILSQHFGSKELKNIMQNEPSYIERESYFSNKLDKSYNDNLNSILAVDYNTYLLDDILTKIDRATMSVSLEGREPLLDHRIIEFVARLPSFYKHNNNTPKIILKNIVHKYIPKSIMDRPKMGFGVPIELWLKDGLKELLMYYFDEKRIEEQGIFNVKSIYNIKNSYLNGRKMSFQKVWALLIFQMWYEKWMQ
ncbi:MAG: asparagine synthase C-terminal domain-containing protein, partial [Bacteroidota bacterium]|nr:asparagine synthase C-terminal domain-containing protein [Bacteroidota bacterium]